jgi:hypothetical protein|tara:strand:+ start:3657 stop:4061 length:405 start_codon:yes stop_codon:yes gene_type:complete
MKYVDDGLGVIYMGKGILTGEEIIQADQKQLSNLDMLKKKKYFLGDFSTVDEAKIITEEIIMIAELDEKMESIAGTNLVVIVASKNILFGLSRMWETFVDKLDWQTYVCRTRVEAEAWLRTKAKAVFDIEITMK